MICVQILRLGLDIGFSRNFNNFSFLIFLIFQTCFKAATCKKGAHTYESMRDACDGLELMTGNVQPCMTKFYSAVYNEKYNCTGERDYLTVSLELFISNVHSKKIKIIPGRPPSSPRILHIRPVLLLPGHWQGMLRGDCSHPELQLQL